jgi:UDP-N-acetylmuramoyl-L-alanyl-D-glutamate--2,6-diaminopimelate ligase
MQDQEHKKGRLITVFGCGGDRDPGKRPLMGRVAEEHSDVVIITSDNPRKEHPEKIIKDILSGIKKTENSKKLIVEVDRAKAIWCAIELAKENDIILIAGKGHEDYQILGEETIAFSDFDEAHRALRNRAKCKDH